MNRIGQVARRVAKLGGAVLLKALAISAALINGNPVMQHDDPRTTQTTATASDIHRP